MNKSDTHSTKCPRCGSALLATDAPEGLCPRCLGALNLATETLLAGNSRPPLPPLDPKLLAAHFPQLEILECLGRGGMGVVYKARQKSLDRLVALKLLAPERDQDPAFADRFAREAKALASLNHPGIVTIHDFGQAGSFYFLLMEFVDGVNLRQLLRARKLSPAEALAIVPPLCDALQFAHDRGIVHRDIKPENLLLAKDGRVKIADFGIAKMLGLSAPDTGMAERQPAGTPGYMAPEQKAGAGEADSRADIYSLGVVFYEMLTGQLPAESLQPPSHRVQIDVRLDEIVLRALAKNPELRWQTAADVRTQVETVITSREVGSTQAQPIHDRPRGRPAASPETTAKTNRWRSGPLAALICGSAILLMFVGFKYLRHPASVPFSQTIAKESPPPVQGGGASAFGPVVEREIADVQPLPPGADESWARTNAPGLIDFETGKLFPPPAHLRDADLAIQKAWMVAEGIDAVGALTQFRGVIGADLVVVPLNTGDWDQLVPEVIEARLAAVPKEEVVILRVSEPLPNTWGFRTREGSVGLLQLTSITRERPSRLTLRYKLVTGGVSPTASPMPAGFTTFAPVPNPTRVYHEAIELASQGRYEEALQRHIWYHENALKYEAGLAGVRLSFALSKWIELGQKYPPARMALVSIRDRDTRKFAEGQGHFTLFMDVAAINRELGHDRATVDLLKKVQEQDQRLAKACYLVAEDALVDLHEYEVCYPYVADWEAVFDSLRRIRELQAKSAGSPATSEQPAWVEASNRSLVGKLANLVEILVATGHRDAAEEVQRRAVILLDDPRIRSLVAAAEARIKNKSRSAN